ncbi:MAG TPA: TIGR04552 family protein, partial [Bdellovibrionota bacterium]|nr:TIGR04552 family protein [Bdellovibrionota bacterium]
EFFHDLGDVRQLLIMVSDSHPQRDWACGILRVMHTMAHAENFLNREYFPEIRRQIVSRFQRHVFVDSNGKLWLGEGERRVQLVRWDVKEEKTFESVVLKLIAKPENVAEDIFDRLGFRIVTETKMEALLAIKYLRAFHIIMFPNIKPTRSRNTLLGMDKVRERVDKIFEKYFNGELSEEETVQQYYLIDEPPSVSRLEQQKANPFSREFYSSIQFTCRQLVRLSHPLVPHLEQMKGIISSVSDDEAKKRLLSIIEHIPIQPYLKLFFPFEMQVMDEESYHLNMEGLASYEEYKAAQLGAAKKRVLGPLLV